MKHVTAPRLPPRTALTGFFSLFCKSAGDKVSYFHLSENVFILSASSKDIFTGHSLPGRLFLCVLTFSAF